MALEQRNHKTPQIWGWGDGSGVKCLLSKAEDLSLDPKHLVWKPGTAACVCKPSTWGEVPTGEPLVYLTAPS